MNDEASRPTDGPTPCADCRTLHDARYCPGCGLRAHPGRLTLRAVARHVGERFSFERGILYTIQEMALDPGGTVQRYLAGRRRRLVGPIAYLAMGMVVSLLTFRLPTAPVEGLVAWTLQTAPAREVMVLSGSQALAFTRLWALAYEHPALPGLVISLLFAGFVRALFRARDINLAEAFVFAFYTFGQAFILQGAILGPARHLGADTGPGLLSTLAPYLVMAGWASGGFFGWQMANLARGLLAVVLSQLAFLLLLSAGLVLLVKSFVP
jgi:hypothetical protein